MSRPDALVSASSCSAEGRIRVQIVASVVASNAAGATATASVTITRRADSESTDAAVLAAQGFEDFSDDTWSYSLGANAASTSERARTWFHSLVLAGEITPAEARLAVALAGGQSLRDYAALRAVSLNAVRFLLKGIFRKTGATSQAQLVAMVARLPSPTI